MASSSESCRDVDLSTAPYAYAYRESALSYVSHPSTTTMSRHCDSEADIDMENDDNSGVPIIPPTNTDNDHDNGPQALPASVANSLLFELPREIREKIYSYCLSTHTDASSSSCVEWPSQTTKRPYHLTPAILRTCKIILSEAAPLLYTLNAFEFRHPSDANVFVRAFASPVCSRQIARVRLDVKATDMRLWMPYLTSTDEVRSLRADFPNLRELSLRYASQKWSQTRSPEDNLKAWIDDIKLEEMLRGLRSVFPSKVTDDDFEYDLGIDDQEFRDYLARNPVNFDSVQETREFRTRLHAAHKIHHQEKMRVARERAAALRKRYISVPVIRVTCVCRVPVEHFNYVTEASAAGQPPPPPQPQPQPATTEGGDAAPVEPLLPVKEGEAFRGFSVLDFRHKAVIPGSGGIPYIGMTRTPSADRHGILLGLELSYGTPADVPLDY